MSGLCITWHGMTQQRKWFLCSLSIPQCIVIPRKNDGTWGPATHSLPSFFLRGGGLYLEYLVDCCRNYRVYQTKLDNFEIALSFVKYDLASRFLVYKLLGTPLCKIIEFVFKLGLSESGSVSQLTWLGLTVSDVLLMFLNIPHSCFTFDHSISAHLMTRV